MSPAVRKPENLPANTIPIDGYILAVDGKFKTRYETSVEAITAGSKLKQNFPVIQVTIFDATKQTYVPVELQDKH
jgi:hypothetical protein